MVQAILAGRKTQTRRVVKHQPHDWKSDLLEKGISNNLIAFSCKGSARMCIPKYQIGDTLWVRETWRKNPQPIGWPYLYRASPEDLMYPDDEKWKPSIFMPREACRIRLKVTDVRVERLNDISEDDALSEGVERLPNAKNELMAYRSYLTTPEKQIVPCFPYVSFRTLWQSINGRESWDANPWVWVYTFEVL